MSNNILNNLTNEILINKPQNTLNELINRNDLSVRTTKLLNELLETTKIIENCTSCIDKNIDGNDLDKIEKRLAELEKQGKRKKQDTIYDLNNKLYKIKIKLNK